MLCCLKATNLERSGPECSPWSVPTAQHNMLLHVEYCILICPEHPLGAPRRSQQRAWCPHRLWSRAPAAGPHPCEHPPSGPASPPSGTLHTLPAEAEAAPTRTTSQGPDLLDLCSPGPLMTCLASGLHSTATHGCSRPDANDSPEAPGQLVFWSC